ncbi:hypothetical protein ACFPM7_02235 [Actinokineospora guangxiensis]|uniref:Capsular polysaccharide biosynthesis protein n=1 Tax=Actinokineospora guangxiensis TaxID=1490288 RepID=A0ABW0EIC9_9PSEU
MDFWKTLLVLLRRWYVAVPVFVITIGAAGAVYMTTPMLYQSTGLLVLTSPSSGPTSVKDRETGQTNPLLAFDSSLAISASIVIQTINTPAVIKELGADKPEHTFELTGGNEGGPFISVTTESESEPGSRELAVQVLDRVRAELTKYQEELEAAPTTFIGVNQIVAPTEPEPLRGSKLRAAGVALVLGFAASLGTVFGLESYQTRKRKRTGDDDEDETTPEPVEPVRPAASAPPRHTVERTQRIRPVQPPANGKPVPAKSPQSTGLKSTGPQSSGQQSSGQQSSGQQSSGPKPPPTADRKAPPQHEPAPSPKPGANQAGAWPADDYREPPTRMMRPAAQPTKTPSDG